MNPRGKFYEKNGRKIFVTRAICDYFSKETFMRLYDAEKYARAQGAAFYVGLYTDELLEKMGRPRPFKDTVSDKDRVFAVEALKFVDGAFLINSLDKELIEQSLDSKLVRQAEEREKEVIKPRKEKKYPIGYASGAFSNLHKGHIEHLRDMSEQCDKVIVAANSDRLIEEYKKKHVSVDDQTRRLILSNIKYVDLALITDEYDKFKAIQKVKDVCGEQFNAIFVGSDWRGSDNWKHFEEQLAQCGIDVVFTERPENGISTSKIDKQKKEATSKKETEGR